MATEPGELTLALPGPSVKERRNQRSNLKGARHMMQIPTEYEGADSDGSDEYDEAGQPIPAVIAWEMLTEDQYLDAINKLDIWAREHITIYQTTTSIIPMCWFAHPDIVHTLSHLYAAFLLTRHPQAGIGMVGLDWDRWRDATYAQLRPMVSQSGCTPSGHKPPLPQPWLTSGVVKNHFHEHITAQAQAIRTQRRHKDLVNAAATILKSAEDRLDLAREILDEICVPGAAPTAEDLQTAELRLTAELQATVGKAERGVKAADTADTNRSGQAHSSRELELARNQLAANMAHPSQQHDPRSWISTVQFAQPTQKLLQQVAAARQPLPDADADARREARRNRTAGIDDLFGPDNTTT